MELGKKSVKNPFLYTIKKAISTLLKFCFVFRGVWQNTNSQGQNVTFDKIDTNSIATWALGSCPDFFREFCYLLYRSTRIDEKNMTTATKNTICKAVLLGSSTPVTRIIEETYNHIFAFSLYFDHWELACSWGVSSAVCCWPDNTRSHFVNNNSVGPVVWVYSILAPVR